MISKLLTLSLALTLAFPLRSITAQDPPPAPSGSVKKIAADDKQRFTMAKGSAK